MWYFFLSLVIERLLFYAEGTIFQLYHGNNKFQWNDNDVCFVLDQHTWLDFYSAGSPKQQSAGRHVSPLWSKSWFSAKQSLLLFLNVACLAEKQHCYIYQFYSLWLNRPGLEFTIYHNQDEHANDYTTDAFFKLGLISECFGLFIYFS